jgi:hypothetical protein
MIETIWSQVEQRVASKNFTFKSKDVKLLREQKIDEMRETE